MAKKRGKVQENTYSFIFSGKEKIKGNGSGYSTNKNMYNNEIKNITYRCSRILKKEYSTFTQLSLNQKETQKCFMKHHYEVNKTQTK